METPLSSLLLGQRLSEAVRFEETVPSVAPDVTQLRLCGLMRQSTQQQDEMKIFLTLPPFHPSSPRFFYSPSALLAPGPNQGTDPD